MKQERVEWLVFIAATLNCLEILSVVLRAQLVCDFHRNSFRKTQLLRKRTNRIPRWNIYSGKPKVHMSLLTVSRIGWNKEWFGSFTYFNFNIEYCLRKFAIGHQPLMSHFRRAFLMTLRHFNFDLFITNWALINSSIKVQNRLYFSVCNKSIFSESRRVHWKLKSQTLLEILILSLDFKSHETFYRENFIFALPRPTNVYRSEFYWTVGCFWFFSYFWISIWDALKCVFLNERSFCGVQYSILRLDKILTRRFRNYFKV